MHGRLTWLRTFTTSCFSNLFFPKILILNAPTFSPSHNPAAETISTSARITTRCILRYVCRMNSTVEAVCFYVSARSITGTSYTQVYFQTACACVRISYVRLHVTQHLYKLLSTIWELTVGSSVKFETTWLHKKYSWMEGEILDKKVYKVVYHEKDSYPQAR